VVVDECVGPTSLIWQSFSRWLGRRPAQVLHLAEQFPGIPDGVILSKIVAPEDILVTTDRVLHNRACANGLRSFTLTPSGQLTEKPLRNIPQKPRVSPAPCSELAESYYRNPHPLARLLRSTLSERDLKHYRTRRRRIRSYFGERGNIQQLALTVGSRRTGQGMLCGFFLKVAGNGAKGLKATEGYCRSAGNLVSPALCALRALAEVYLLDLEDICVSMCLLPSDSLALSSLMLSRPDTCPESVLLRSLHRLLHGFVRLSLHPCTKGVFFDAMMSKLNQLSSGSTNEVTVFDFVQIGQLISEPQQGMALSILDTGDSGWSPDHQTDQVKPQIPRSAL